MEIVCYLALCWSTSLPGVVSDYLSLSLEERKRLRVHHLLLYLTAPWWFSLWLLDDLLAKATKNKGGKS